MSIDRFPRIVRQTVQARVTSNKVQYPTDDRWWHLESIERAEAIMVKSCEHCQANLAEAKAKKQSYVWMKRWDIMGEYELALERQRIVENNRGA